MKRNALKAAGDDEGAREYDLKVRQGNKRLNEYCAENGLTVRDDRMKVYGYKDSSKKVKEKEFVLTTAHDSGILNPKGTIGDSFPVTLDSINKVPPMNILGDEHLNLRHRQASKKLLLELKTRNLDIDTEMSIIYSSDMRRIPGCDYIEGVKSGKVNIDNVSIPYHAFHTHPSDKSFSFPDIRGMASRPNMISLTAQGNAGSKYVMIRREKCDNDGYYIYLSKRSTEVFYSIGKTDFTLEYVHDKNKETEVKKTIASLSDSEREDLYIALRKITDECIAEGDRYGFSYKFQLA